MDFRIIIPRIGHQRTLQLRTQIHGTSGSAVIHGIIRHIRTTEHTDTVLAGTIRATITATADTGDMHITPPTFTSRLCARLVLPERPPAAGPKSADEAERGRIKLPRVSVRFPQVSVFVADSRRR
jgi:hypothetical protein